MAWAYSTYVGERVAILAATAVLGRILEPSQFGIVAQAALFITLFETLSDFGLTQALIIVDRQETERRASAVFKYSVLIGVLSAGLVAALGPVAAAFFHEPKLETILPVLGVTLFIRSIGSTHYALAQKNLEFRRRTVAEICDVTARSAVGITLAVVGLAEWSLVLGFLAGATAFTTALWLVVPFRPRLRTSGGAVRGMLRFGGALTGLDIVAALIANVDYLFVGRYLGASELGIYTFGFKLPELLVINFSVVAGRVLFPAFAAADPASRASAFLRSFHYTLVLCLPMAVTLALLARPIIHVAFSETWLPSVPVMRAICVYAFALAVGVPAGTVYKATGRANILLTLALPRAALVVGSIAVFVDRGIVAVALCQASVAGLFSVIGLVLAVHLFGIRGRDLWRAAATPIVASGALAAVLVAVDVAVADPLAVVALGGVFGSLVFAGTLWLVDRESLLQARDLATGRAATAAPVELPAAGAVG
jgi:PST family polysaccharide transporter